MPIRTYNNTDGGTPTGHFPAPAPYRPPAPCRYVDPGPPEREEEEEWEEEPEEDRPTLAESLQGLMRMFNVPTLPTPARPAPVHQAPATRPAARPIAPPPACSAPTRPTTARPAPLPAPGPQRTPYEILREEQRRDSVCSLARSLGGPLYVWFDQPAGACEVLDVNLTPDRQRCRATPTHAVVIHGGLAQQTHAYACETHALHLAGHVDRFEGLEAACHLLRKRR